MINTKSHLFLSTQNNDENFKYEDDNSSPGTMKLRQVENFQSYEDVLNISCVSSTTCLFGTNDYVMKLLFINYFLFLFFHFLFY